jgi:hypothetical protein
MLLLLHGGEPIEFWTEFRELFYVFFVSADYSGYGVAFFWVDGVENIGDCFFCLGLLLLLVIIFFFLLFFFFMIFLNDLKLFIVFFFFFFFNIFLWL